MRRTVSVIAAVEGKPGRTWTDAGEARSQSARRHVSHPHKVRDFEVLNRSRKTLVNFEFSAFMNRCEQPDPVFRISALKRLSLRLNENPFLNRDTFKAASRTLVKRWGAVSDSGEARTTTPRKRNVYMGS